MVLELSTQYAYPSICLSRLAVIYYYAQRSLFVIVPFSYHAISFMKWTRAYQTLSATPETVYY